MCRRLNEDLKVAVSSRRAEKEHLRHFGVSSLGSASRARCLILVTGFCTKVWRQRQRASGWKLCGQFRGIHPSAANTTGSNCIFGIRSMQSLADAS
ncbi:hypothetical protein PoB_006658600 [Plakobranchus ocellatus]|uniref:Uncharacterized protein n=1 Tax=Plakobranchus ocellatus TaxID=259542 RepID=A0AAV4D803_9GAST|nr:hypothetical protein PoB_006658600 [Plakobranchus ocellatus]